MATWARLELQSQEYRNGPYLISTDPARLDMDRIHRFLSNWPGWETDGISRPVLERALKNSLCFGVFEGEQQIDAFLQRQRTAGAVPDARAPGHLLPLPDNDSDRSAPSAPVGDGFFYALIRKSSS